MTKSIFKSHIQSVHPYEPGKPMKELERELGLKKIVKLASNENPLGSSPKAVQAMRKAILESHLYPESSCHYLVEKLSKLKADDLQQKRTVVDRYLADFSKLYPSLAPALSSRSKLVKPLCGGRRPLLR